MSTGGRTFGSWETSEEINKPSRKEKEEARKHFEKQSKQQVSVIKEET